MLSRMSNQGMLFFYESDLPLARRGRSSRAAPEHLDLMLLQPLELRIACIITS